MKGKSQSINTCKICKYISNYVLFNTDQTFNSITDLEIEIKCLGNLIAFTKRMLRLPPKSLKSRKVCLVLIGKGCSIIKSVYSH